jgi:hypothetical protein
MPNSKSIECYFCGTSVPNAEAAIDANWVPSFYERGSDYETLEPVCEACSAKFLEPDQDGELVRKED